MKRKIIFRALFDFDEEDRFLNDMSAKGFDLVRWFPYIYVFERGEPGVWTYRSGLLPRADKEQYLAFMADAGIETVVVAFNGTATFRKRTAEGPFEVLSDTESRIALQQTWRKRWFYVGWLLVLPYAALNLVMSGLYSPLEMAPLLLVELSGISVVIVQAVRATKRLRALEAERLLVE